MSFDVFVAVTLVVCWGFLPASVALAVKFFDDEAIGGDEH